MNAVASTAAEHDPAAGSVAQAAHDARYAIPSAALLSVTAAAGIAALVDRPT